MPSAGTMPNVAALTHNDARFLVYISVFGFDFAQRCHGRFGDALCRDLAWRRTRFVVIRDRETTDISPQHL
jgi:hypothetical protein